MKTKLLGPVLTCLLISALTTHGLGVQDTDESKTDRKPAATAENKDNDKESEKPESDDESEDEKPIMAIVGADIHTVSGPVIRQGTLLVQDGKILEVGQDVSVPDGATVIDATGKTVTPGFVAISMRRIGVGRTPSGREKLADALNPFDRNMKYALGVGITSGCIELTAGGGRFGRRAPEGTPREIYPGLEKPIEEYETEAMLDYGNVDTALCPCCGLPVLPTEPITPTPPSPARQRKMAVVKLSYGNLDAMLMKENAFYSPSPGALSSALQRHNWRVTVGKARKAIQEKAKADQAKTTTKSTSTTKPSSATTGKRPSASSSRPRTTPVKPELLSLLKQETAMRIRVNTVDEIRDMVDLAQELGYHIIIEGGIEAWRLGKELGAAEVGVIYTPRQRRDPQPGREDSTGSFIESPRIFQESGIPFAIATLSNSISMNGLAGRDLSSLPLEAAFAIRGGATDKAALEALTITPARMLGLDDRIGSIDEGKDADLLILNGAPLDYRTYVEQAIVAGKIAYDRKAEKIYPVYDRED